MGIVIDGMIRDYLGLIAIPDYTVCARGHLAHRVISRWRDTQHKTGQSPLPGTLTSQVRIAPGDWVMVRLTGLSSLPQEIAMEVLVQSEEIERKEELTRRDLAVSVF